MSMRYSERLIESFRGDELSKGSGTGIQGRNGGTSKDVASVLRKREPSDVPAGAQRRQSIPL